MFNTFVCLSDLQIIAIFYYSASRLLLGLSIIMTVFERQVTQMTRDDVRATEIDFQTVSTDADRHILRLFVTMTVVSKRSRMRRGPIQSQKMLLPSVQ